MMREQRCNTCNFSEKATRLRCKYHNRVGIKASGSCGAWENKETTKELEGCTYCGNESISFNYCPMCGKRLPGDNEA